MCKEYNGHANYQTWAVSLWIDNDPGLHWQVANRARWTPRAAAESSNVQNGIWTEQEYTRFVLADYIKELIEELNPLADDASMYSDIMGHALGGVDWEAVAGHYLEEG